MGKEIERWEINKIKKYLKDINPEIVVKFFLGGMENNTVGNHPDF